MHDGFMVTVSDDYASLERWLAAGGGVRVVDVGPPLTVALLTCDGGQEVQRLTTDDPAVLHRVAELGI